MYSQFVAKFSDSHFSTNLAQSSCVKFLYVLKGCLGSSKWWSLHVLTVEVLVF
jgi:hypothetical protein